MVRAVTAGLHPAELRMRLTVEETVRALAEEGIVIDPRAA